MVKSRAVPNMGFSVFGRIPNSSLQYSAEYEYEQLLTREKENKCKTRIMQHDSVITH